MNLYLGIDLGTSGVKILLVSSEGTVVDTVTEHYPVNYPSENWTEQDPVLWWEQVCVGLKKVISRNNKNDIKGISFGGQMHGLVVLDENDDVIRPCILWNDGRTEKEVEYLNVEIGEEKLISLTSNIAFAGFTAPKILWLRKNEPENFEKIHKIMLPKDYLSYKLTGRFVTDYSDAAGTLLLDVKNKKWSSEMLDICNISIDQMPLLLESYEVVGNIKPDIADELGLNADVKIIIGASDNAAAAIGTGTIGDGTCNISLGTSGTIFLPSTKYEYDDNKELHCFCHSDGNWHLMGCVLSAANCRMWWLEDIIGTDDYITDEIEMKNVSTKNLYFLPYLNGERSPYNDVNAKGAFIGLKSNTTRAEMSKAVLEGVAFALKDCLDVANKYGIFPKHSMLCGGGARSDEWKQIIADVFNMPIHSLQTEQGPGYGAAILAMVGCGEFSDLKVAINSLIVIKKTIYPIEENVKFYNEKHKNFKKIYPLLKNIF